MSDDGGDRLLASAAVRALRACLQSRASRTQELIEAQNRRLCASVNPLAPSKPVLGRQGASLLHYCRCVRVFTSAARGQSALT